MNATTIALSTLAVALAYLIGSIPFGYLTAYWVKGVDIRTLGSGNVGATNVGRILGFKFFLLVFVFDVLKGLLPTLGFPLAVESIAGAGNSPPELPVLIALATILGHNFSVFLRFQGGKGVATSLGALLALDPIASVSAVVGFLIVLVITRYVSMSSILAGVCFFIAHFSRVDDPFGREQIAMTILTAALLVLLVVRHRSNLSRIASGTESKVPLRFGKGRRPEGRVGVLVVLALVGVTLVLGAGLSVFGKSKAELDCGTFMLAERGRVSTGHQRANDLTFADEGRLLVVACPRYNRVVFYRVTDAEELEVLQDVALDGRPMALEATSDRVYVLQRPTGDARHLVEGYWEAFDFSGERLGSKFRLGWDPDDLAVLADRGLAFVLTSGHAEGETGRPNPALEVMRLGSGAEDHQIIGRLEFDHPEDDPERLTLSTTGLQAVVTLDGSEQVALIDLGDPEQPTLLGRSPLKGVEAPHLSTADDGDRILMPAGSGREAVLLDLACSTTLYLVTTLPGGSGLEVIDTSDRRSLGRLPLGGRGQFGGVRPTGIAAAPGRGLLAVADRAGGVHLIAVRDHSVADHVLAAGKNPPRR
ncbi:hypothetical protein BH23PLA1_BH23PLA1_17170 [soil metagenome]